MVTYTVHEPMPHASAVRERAMNIAFIKEGVSWPGLVFGLPWLLVRGLWLELLVIFGAAVAAGSAMMALGASIETVSWGFTALNLIVGFELFNLQRWKLERRGHEMVGVVSGRDMEECEGRFFQNWAPLIGHYASAGPRPHSGGTPAIGNGERQVIGFLTTGRA
ncbi:MAG: DUF2628 domain-containing protein [Chitinophagales bacterium]|nr:DUF2628 domain-containing protein [Hyphomicrobiales bacterium]